LLRLCRDRPEEERFMTSRSIAVTAGIAIILSAPLAFAQDSPVVVMETSLGAITVELAPAEAPISVENFLAYVDAGHYDNTIFHRVIQGFMIQGGAFSPEMRTRPTRDPIKNEAENGLTNDRYTITMARTSEIDSATDQFFINTVDNNFLNNGVRDFGYAVFGRVIDGNDVVDRIAAVPATNSLPSETVVIQSIRRR
jgi:peptidyl-prolyl cis-trans isomerase A (cyclophilin A)